MIKRFGPWVYQVARSAIAEQRRVRARHPLADGDPPESYAEEPAEVEERSAEAQLARAVMPFIATMESPYREALTLTELEGRSQKQAASMLGISISGMKSRVQRGRARLRRMLHLCCEIGLDTRGQVIACAPRARTPEAFAAAMKDCRCTADQSSPKRRW